MTTTGTRYGMRFAALAAAAGLLLASCSSEPEATPTPSPSLLESSAAALPSEQPTVAPIDAAGLACAAYFELDLLNSSYSGGAVADGDMTEEQVKADFKRLLKELVTQAKVAVSDGVADPKLSANAVRMRKTVNKLKKAESLADLSKKQQLRFAKSSLRVQKACDRAGYPLPDDNITARTAAGL